MRRGSAESWAASFCQHDSQIANVGAGWAGYDQIVELGEETVGVAAGEKVVSIEAEISSTVDGGLVGDRAGCKAVAIDAVGTGAQHNHMSTLFIETHRAA